MGETKPQPPKDTDNVQAGTGICAPPDKEAEAKAAEGKEKATK